MVVLKPPSFFVFFSFYHKNAALVKKWIFQQKLNSKEEIYPETGKKMK